MMAEFLVRKRLVAQQHGVARLDESDRATRKKQSGFKTGTFGKYRQQYLSCLHRLSDVNRTIGHDSRSGCFYQQLSPGSSLHEVPLDRRELLLQRGVLGFQLTRDFREILFELCNRPQDQPALTLEPLPRSNQIEHHLFLLLKLQLTDEMIAGKLAISVEHFLGQLHLFLSCRFFLIEGFKFLPCNNELSFDSR